MSKAVLKANVRAGVLRRCAMCTMLATQVVRIDDHEFYVCKEHKNELSKKDR